MTFLLFARLRPMLPASVPVVPAVLALTVHVADGAPPDATADVTEGAVPPMFDVDRLKLLVVTPFTGSVNVTVHVNGLALVGLEPPRVIDETNGAAVSYV